MPEYEILITRKTSRSSKVKVDTENYTAALEQALKLARLGHVTWNEESAIVQHDCEDFKGENSIFPKVA